MNRDLSISVAVSLAAHAALLLALSVWTITRVSRDLSGTAPAVSVQVITTPTPQGDGVNVDATTDIKRALPPPATPAAAAQGPRVSPVAAAPPPTHTPAPAAMDPVPAATATTNPPTPPPATEPPTSEHANAAPAPAAQSDVTTSEHDTVAPATIVIAQVTEEAPPVTRASQAIARAPVLKPMTVKQEKMLVKQVRNWASTVHRMDLRDSTTTWRYKNQEYRAQFVHQAADDTGIDEVMVQISTVVDGATLSSNVRLRRLAFSSFAQFVNRWDPNVQIHDDELTGRFHSNSAITLGYTRTTAPTFHGKVTTASRAININRDGGSVARDEMFQGGLETGVRRIQLPKRYQAVSHERADRQTFSFDVDTRLVFGADGTCLAGPADRSTSPRKITLVDGTANFTAGRKARLFVSGTVRGNLLVYSPDDIIIEGNLVYAHDPHTQPDGDDYLGLVSDKSVVIAHPDVTGPGDLHVHASIYAKRRFAVTRYRHRDSALLHIYGSVSAGSLSATEPRYATRIIFDPRLETRRAPGFPMTDRYETVAWDRTWHSQ